MSQATTIAAHIEPEMEFDMTLEDSEDDPSAFDAEPLVPPQCHLLQITKRAWSIQGDSEDTVNLPEVEAEILLFSGSPVERSFRIQRSSVHESVPRFSTVHSETH